MNSHTTTIKKNFYRYRFMLLVPLASGILIYNVINSRAGEIRVNKKVFVNTNSVPAPPITATVYAELLSLRSMMTYYDSAAAKNKAVNFTDTKIDLVDLIRFYDGIAKGNFSWGLRFYPSFSQADLKISLIMSVSKNDNSDNEKAFYLLSDTSYNYSNKLLLTDTLSGSKTAASALFDDYFKNVKINLASQSNASDTFKISRFYNYAEFLQFFSANIPDFNTADARSYSDYSLGVEFGYINSAAASTFYSRYGELVSEGNVNNYIGYTVLLSLYKNGKQLLDPSQKYGAGNYTNAIMEVGNPCPPTCGSIK